MWTRRDLAKILALAALFLVAGLLLFPAVSSPTSAWQPTPDASWGT